MPPRVKKNENFGNPFEDSPDDSAPFETDPPQSEPDEAQTNTSAPTERTGVFVKNTAEGAEGKITVTLKAGRDFDAPWVVIHGLNAADVLTTMSDPDFPNLLTWTTKAAQKFGEGWNPSSGGQNTGQRAAPAQNRSQGQPPAATQHPKGERKFCEHGEKKFASGISQKNNKPWYAFDCPTNDCPREFVKI